jgi:hypothetical protein
VSLVLAACPNGNNIRGQTHSGSYLIAIEQGSIQKSIGETLEDELVITSGVICRWQNVLAGGSYRVEVLQDNLTTIYRSVALKNQGGYLYITSQVLAIVNAAVHLITHLPTWIPLIVHSLLESWTSHYEYDKISAIVIGI